LNNYPFTVYPSTYVKRSSNNYIKIRGLYIKSSDVIISISIFGLTGLTLSYQVELGILNLSTMNAVFTLLKPELSPNDVSRVIFLSETRYFFQT
jgi:hypothetical protein